MNNELKIGQRYSKDNNVFEIVNLNAYNTHRRGFIKTVQYRKVLNEGEISEVLCDDLLTINADTFKETFIPRLLSVGDKIIGMSMGKEIVRYNVVKIVKGVAACEYENGKDSEILFSDIIQCSGRAIAIFPDNKFTHINCLEYYVICERIDKILKKTELIKKCRSNLFKISEKLNKLNVSDIKIEDIEKYDKQIELLEHNL